MLSIFPERMNFIWSRDPQEAYENPYEYEAQEQFLREAKIVLDLSFFHLMKLNRCFKRDDTSVSKAVWMLHVDACDTLRDCVELLSQKKHRPAGKLFRDVIESIDFAAYFQIDPIKSEPDLKKWYDNVSPKHIKIREWMHSKEIGDQDELHNEYYAISKFTHRTYRVLAYNYILGKDDILIYEGEDNYSLLPHPVALCCSLLGNCIKAFSNSMLFCSLINNIEASAFWEDAVEKEPLKRIFTTPQEIYQKYLVSKLIEKERPNLK